jgi:ABC-type oligopeptide transport system substrate-binding subunit
MFDQTVDRRTLLRVSAASAATTAIAGLGLVATAQDTAPEGAAADQTLRIAALADAVQLDPHFSYGRSTTGTFTNVMWAGLTKVNADLEVVPDIALSWDLSEDGLLYTFHIDPERKFSDGTPITAHTVVGAWNRSLNPETQSLVAGSYLRDVIGAADYWRGESTELPTGFRAIDDLTLEVELFHPRNYFHKILSHPSTFIINPDEVATHTPDDPWTLRAVSFSGPFAVESYQDRQLLTLVRNEYYPTNPTLQHIVYRLADDVQTQFLLYQNDEVDITPLGIADADNVKNQDPTYREEFVEQPIWWLDNLYMRQELAPFDDVNVRKAFAMSIDKATILTAVERDLYTNMDGIFHPEMDVYESGEPVLAFDPDAARAALEASSYGSADALPNIAFWVTGTEATGTEATRAAAMQEMWRQNLGVNVEIRVVPTYEEMLESDVQLVIGSEGIQYPDGSTAVGYLLCDSPANIAQFCDEDFDALVAEAGMTQDEALAIDLYRQAQAIALDSAALLPLWRRANHYLVKPHVQNFVTTAMYTMPSLADTLYISEA